MTDKELKRLRKKVENRLIRYEAVIDLFEETAQELAALRRVKEKVQRRLEDARAELMREEAQRVASKERT